MSGRLKESTRKNRAIPRRASLTAMALALTLFSGTPARPATQATTHTDATDHIRGVVINSVTHEPISRALVFSPDNAFAAMTDHRGRFEFSFTSPEPQQSTPSNNGTVQIYDGRFQNPNRPNALMARKVGFLNPEIPVDISDVNSTQLDLTISLVPEARIVGHVIVPGSDGADKMQVALYRRNLHENQEHWDLTVTAVTRADGEFRLVDLPPGSYKLLTLEQMDRDPLTTDPRGELFGYPPLYYPGASDFDTAAIIRLAPGDTFQSTMSPTRGPYYPVNLGLTTPLATPQIQINVWPQAHPGPGYSLGYNRRDGAIVGFLPNGAYTLQVTNYGPNVMAGQLNFTVGGAPVSGLAVTLVSGTSIAVNVKEEFQHTEINPSPDVFARSDGPSAVAPNTRRPNYLQITLLPDEQFGLSAPVSLRPPAGPDDESLVIENVLPGRYRVSVNTSVGYVSSITSGSTDLLHQPLVVGMSASVSPFEITVRDDGVELDGTVYSSSAPLDRSTANSASTQPLGIVCLAPLDSMDTRCRTVWASADGTFSFQQLAPGSYRALAMDRALPRIDWLSDEILAQYESKIQVVRVAHDQKERIRLPLITAKE
jgi:hypothetical protein